MTSGLEIYDKPALQVTDVPVVTPDVVPVMFVEGTAHTLTDDQFARIKRYVDLGGHVYYENKDWHWHGDSPKRTIWRVWY